MQNRFELELHISHEQQGTYFTIPFNVPKDIEKLEVAYSYSRRTKDEIPLASGILTATPEISIVDFGLIAPDGSQAGASGSDKTQILLSETHATAGYQPRKIDEGEWRIMVGAYKVPPQGVDVSYQIILTAKSVRLLKGDLHVHTIASDGVHTIEELGFKAKANGLDFLAITDHNTMISAHSLPRIPGVTLIPGVEWTHYQGHANFLGVDQPYDGPFFTNSEQEAAQRFISAHQRSALSIVNHPFEGNSSFRFDLNSIPFDCLEVWNGPMRESNLRAVGLWQQLLVSGKRVPICGGSDYHRDNPFIFLGGPTTSVFSLSAGMTDILEALRAGHSFITFAPGGPEIEMVAGEHIMGDEVDWNHVREIELTVRGLVAGDEVKMITNSGSEILHKADSDGFLEISYAMNAPGFARVEVTRAFLPGLPMLPALLSNPIYFKA